MRYNRSISSILFETPLLKISLREIPHPLCKSPNSGKRLVAKLSELILETQRHPAPFLHAIKKDSSLQ